MFTGNFTYVRQDIVAQNTTWQMSLACQVTESRGGPCLHWRSHNCAWLRQGKNITEQTVSTWTYSVQAKELYQQTTLARQCIKSIIPLIACLFREITTRLTWRGRRTHSNRIQKSTELIRIRNGVRPDTLFYCPTFPFLCQSINNLHALGHQYFICQLTVSLIHAGLIQDVFDIYRFEMCHRQQSHSPQWSCISVSGCVCECVCLYVCMYVCIRVCIHEWVWLCV